jgi:hypothetical protein
MGDVDRNRFDLREENKRPRSIGGLKESDSSVRVEEIPKEHQAPWN